MGIPDPPIGEAKCSGKALVSQPMIIWKNFRLSRNSADLAKLPELLRKP
jgi:hypothetical protein